MSYLFCSHKFHIICKLFDFSKDTKKCEPIDEELENLTRKIVTICSQKYGSGIRAGIHKKLIPDPGVKKAPDPGSAKLVTMLTQSPYLLTFTARKPM